MAIPGEATLLLRRLSRGEECAADQLLPLLYGELHRIARGFMEGERGDHTLQPTALVHEAYLRLMGGARMEWEDRAHFLNVAARAMRRVLVDHARKRHAKKRGGRREREPLDDAVDVYAERGLDVLALDDALERLAGVDDQLARIVELRYFAGLSNPEAARVIGMPLRSLERGWFSARAWLRAELGGVEGS